MELNTRISFAASAFKLSKGLIILCAIKDHAVVLGILLYTC